MYRHRKKHDQKCIKIKRKKNNKEKRERKNSEKRVRSGNNSMRDVTTKLRFSSSTVREANVSQRRQRANQKSPHPRRNMALMYNRLKGGP